MVFLCYDVHLLTGRQLPLKRFPLVKDELHPFDLLSGPSVARVY